MTLALPAVFSTAMAQQRERRVEPAAVPVRYAEGTVHGFLELRTATGALLALPRRPSQTKVLERCGCAISQPVPTSTTSDSRVSAKDLRPRTACTTDSPIPGPDSEILQGLGDL
jgi:hypothetical protein